MNGPELAKLLTNSNLIGADITGSDLTNAKLSGADLSGADLTNANLSGAQFDDFMHVFANCGTGHQQTFYNAKDDECQSGCWAGDLEAFIQKISGIDISETMKMKFQSQIELMKKLKTKYFRSGENNG